MSNITCLVKLDIQERDSVNYTEVPPQYDYPRDFTPEYPDENIQKTNNGQRVHISRFF